MSDERQPGFWLRLDGEWQRFEVDELTLRAIPSFSASLTAVILLTDLDAAREPLPLLAQRFAGDALRYRTSTLGIEASVRLKGCGRRTTTASHRSLVPTAERDEAARACSAVAEVEFDLR